MTWSLRRLKCPVLISELTEYKWWKMFFNLFIQNSACCKYWSVLLSWELYCDNMTKSTTAWVKCIAVDAHWVRSDTIMNTIWCITNFQFNSVHCLMTLYLLNLFSSEKIKTEWNCWSNCIVSDTFKTVSLTSFFFFLIRTLSSISSSNQRIRYVTVFLSSWCSTLIIIVT